MLQKRPRVQSKKLRDSACGQDCTLRLTPSACDSSTVVLAHLPGRISGTSAKENDTHAVFACRVCHDYLDGRMDFPEGKDVLYRAAIRALAETQDFWLRSGLMTVR